MKTHPFAVTVCDHEDRIELERFADLNDALTDFFAKVCESEIDDNIESIGLWRDANETPMMYFMAGTRVLQ